MQPRAVERTNGIRRSNYLPLKYRRIVLPKSKSSTPPQDVPKLSERIEFNPQDSGFTLTTDEQTLREIEEIHEDAIKAAQAIRKFAWK